MVLRRFYPSNDNETLSADVNYSIQAALDSMTRDLKKNSIQLNLDLADLLPPVRLIAHQLQNIFLSLLQDLLDTALPGSLLEIRTRKGGFDNIAITHRQRPGWTWKQARSPTPSTRWLFPAAKPGWPCVYLSAGRLLSNTAVRSK